MTDTELKTRIEELHEKLLRDLTLAAMQKRRADTPGGSVTAFYDATLFEQAVEVITMLRAKVELLESQAAQIHAILSRVPSKRKASVQGFVCHVCRAGGMHTGKCEDQ